MPREGHRRDGLDGVGWMLFRGKAYEGRLNSEGSLKMTVTKSELPLSGACISVPRARKSKRGLIAVPIF